MKIDRSGREQKISQTVFVLRELRRRRHLYIYIELKFRPESEKRLAEEFTRRMKNKAKIFEL